MFNPEKLLGGMLRSGMGGCGRGLGSLASGGAALGLVGVAMEAVEHFMNKPSGAPHGSAPSAPPPLPGAASWNAASTAPPPPPKQTAGPSMPPPVPPAGSPAQGQHEAVLLIRAMIAAANADGQIDEQERAAILDRLQSVDLSKEEHEFVVHELLAPKPMQELLEEVKNPEMARQVYTASLLAIEVDTDAERLYLQTLAKQLQIEDQTLSEIHQQLGIPTL